MRFMCANRISTFLRSRRERLEGFSVGEGANVVSYTLVDIARNLANCSRQGGKMSAMEGEPDGRRTRPEPPHVTQRRHSRSRKGGTMT